MTYDWHSSLSREYFREFQGRGVIVAGGAGGMGAALADAFHWLGAKVAIVDKSIDLALSLAADLKDRGAKDSFNTFDPAAITADMGDEVERTRAMAAAVDAVGAPAAFISTLGYDSRVGFEALGQAQAEMLMRINFFAPFFAARDVLEPMRRGGGGAICLFTSRHGAEIFEPDMTGYGCAKAALDSGIRRLAVRAGEGNSADNIIRVFGFCPGWVQTDAQKARFTKQNFIDAAREQLVPRGMGPEDIVPSLVFSLSHYAGLLSGATLRLDGGEGQIKTSAVTDGSKKGAA
ncbi:MAG: SDR family NAD(P)-dependent oxidoreductase [Micavibrio sp.]|nr:SDR family NAD(P)-dependent oxidoreductase [Micavibrio sp.]